MALIALIPPVCRLVSGLCVCAPLVMHGFDSRESNMYHFLHALFPLLSSLLLSNSILTQSGVFNLQSSLFSLLLYVCSSSIFLVSQPTNTRSSFPSDRYQMDDDFPHFGSSCQNSLSYESRSISPLLSLAYIQV